MASANNEFVGENNDPNLPNHQNQSDGVETSVTLEGSAVHAQATPLDVPPPHQPPQPEDPLVGQILREQADNMRGQNELIREQNRRLRAVEDSRAASRTSRSVRRQRSPTPENNRSRSRITLLHKGTTTFPHQGTDVHPLGEITVHHRGTEMQLLVEEMLVIPQEGNLREVETRGTEDPSQEESWTFHSHEDWKNPPTLDKYDGTTDPDEHVQSVETALDYRNLRGSIKCKLFPLSLVRGASTWWRNLPSGSIDSWEELCRMFTAHFTTSRRHPKTVASLKAIVQGPEESLRSYIERFNKVSVDADKMKLYLLEEGLREGTKFQEAVGIVEVQTLDAFFELSQWYIKWEDKQKASEVRRPKTFEEANRVIGGVALAISRPEDFLPLPSNEEKVALNYLAAHLDGSWENFPGALVISGGGFNPVTIRSIKRKFDELEKASPVEEIKITEVKESSVPLAFYREEVPGGSPNFQIPLLVRAKMANFDVRRILVDQGSSCDIMYLGLFKVMQLTEENLVPYVGSDLQGFNGSTTKPWGYVDLIVTFGENKAMKSVKVKFLVVDCPSLYNCIIGRSTLVELFAVSSTIHLKLKYYTKDGRVATINGDIEAARRCFEAASKNLNSVVMPKKKKEETMLPGVNSISIEDGVELDARTSKKERKQEKKAIKDDLVIKENYSPIPDGEFKLVPLGEDPTKGVKIGADLPDLGKRQLKACLRENAELFAWSAAEMLGIDPEIVCHQLTIDPRASAVVQRRRKQSPEKAEAARKAVKDLLEANFIAEAQYTTWLSNVVLVKKSNGKWRATYQRMMNKVFHNEIGDKLEVYMDDMIVKSEEEIDHTIHLKRVFDQARKVNMRAFFDYPTPKSKKSIQTLNGMLTSMARFIAKSAQHALPLFKLLRKETTFEWNEECEGALQHLKRALSEPPVLTRPVEGEKLYLYLAVASETISAVLIRETEQWQKPVYFETLTKPSIEKAVEVMHICNISEQSWMAPVYNFLKSNTLPADAKQATKIRKRACSYVLLDDKLYRRGFLISLLKCVEETRVEFILQEIHEGINGQHIGRRSLAGKALRAGFYWPTMQNDAKDHVLKYDKCQRHGDMYIEPANELKTLISPWPFAWWGMDILVHKQNFQEFLATIGTTQHFTSVEHPQTNGQTEAANRVILRGLRRRMSASKGNWTDELHNVVWSYRTTPYSTTGETPFRLTYGTEAVIPVEIGESSSRIEYPHEEDINDELLREELDLVEELRTGASLREVTLK
ncbi:hypothetical protein TSUD_161470 [Trifolium subterraneum]|uniref:Integrase catalytic domain-containing protein n=1 Tax=Trifolium subterraneum TaxID=3900 RepID=A0A2Z6M5V4_TRISU|nr:hypothetical protein TSUD_161470 [Trifolium subterraneum]